MITFRVNLEFRSRLREMIRFFTFRGKLENGSVQCIINLIVMGEDVELINDQGLTYCRDRLHAHFLLAFSFLSRFVLSQFHL